MLRINSKRPSTILMALSVILLCLGISLAVFVYTGVNNLRHDARMINEAGMVRGMIQRVSKIAIADPTSPILVMTSRIDELIFKFKKMRIETSDDEVENEFYQGVSDLDNKWNELKSLLVSSNKRSIIMASEKCWNAANIVVSNAQQVTEKKVNSLYQLVKLILLLIVLSIIFIILLIYITIRKKLEHETAHDPLTGLSNRRAYDLLITAEIDRYKRYKMPLSLILFDIDYFKKVNDKYGHRTGDRVLVELSELVAKSIRKIDAVFRVGGEEFAIICPDTNVQGAFRVAEKVRLQVEQAVFDVIDGVSISSGVAELEDGVSKENLYHNADQALYLAKKNGRNRSEIFNK